MVANVNFQALKTADNFPLYKPLIINNNQAAKVRCNVGRTYAERQAEKGTHQPYRKEHKNMPGSTSESTHSTSTNKLRVKVCAKIKTRYSVLNDRENINDTSFYTRRYSL